MTASCLACSQGVTVGQFCQTDKRNTPGCEVDCKGADQHVIKETKEVRCHGHRREIEMVTRWCDCNSNNCQGVRLPSEDEFCCDKEATGKSFANGKCHMAKVNDTNRGCPQLKRSKCYRSDACAWDKESALCTDKSAPHACSQLSTLECKASGRCKVWKTVITGEKKACQAKGNRGNELACSRKTSAKRCRKSKLRCKWKEQETTTRSCVERK
jgi:hypothetical protein